MGEAAAAGGRAGAAGRDAHADGRAAVLLLRVDAADVRIAAADGRARIFFDGAHGVADAGLDADLAAVARAVVVVGARLRRGRGVRVDELAVCVVGALRRRAHAVRAERVAVFAVTVGVRRALLDIAAAAIRGGAEGGDGQHNENKCE